MPWEATHMIAVILASWVLWTCPLGDPEEAKPSAYYTTKQECEAEAARSYVAMWEESQRLRATGPDFKNRDTIRAINATHQHYACVPGDVPRETVVQGFRARFGKNVGFFKAIWQGFWELVDEVGFWRAIGICVQVMWQILAAMVTGRSM
jgi:hypothetical protein